VADETLLGRADVRAAPGGGQPGRLAVAGVAVTIAGAATNALGYLVPLIGARRLNPADLGALAAAMALVALATTPGLGLQIAVGVRTARTGAALGAGRLAIAASALIGGAILVATPLVAAALHLPPVVPALVAATAVPAILTGRWLGEMQGRERFGGLAIGMVIFAVGRYAGVAGGLLAGAGLVNSLAIGAAVAWLAVPPVALLAGRPFGERALVRIASPTSEPRLSRHALAAASAALAMLVVANVDLLLARHLLTGAESGAYAVGAVLTKGALWAPQVVTVLALPRLARQEAGALRVGIVLIVGCGAVLTTAAALFGGLAVAVAGGGGFQELVGHAGIFAAIGAIWALVYLLLNARIAAGVRRPAAPLWAVAGLFTAVAMLLSPDTLGQLAGLALAAAATAAVTLAVRLWRDRDTGLRL
jgi:hypothetical protein